MTMTFSLHDSISPNGAFDQAEPVFGPSGRTPNDDMHIISQKLRAPAADGYLARPRIDAIMERSKAHFPATLITGRAGTGKTAVAAKFAAKHGPAAWLTVEATETDWSNFSQYFFQCVKNGSADHKYQAGHGKVSELNIAKLLVDSFSSGNSRVPSDPELLVLDDIHHIFDAEWFDAFFNLLLHSLPPTTHLVLLCRSEPPSPLWRLRSKQMLNVLNEDLIAFDLDETRHLYKSLGLNTTQARDAHSRSYGRISKLLEIADRLQARSAA